MAVFSGNGAVGSPSFTFSSENTAGMYRVSAGNIAFSTAGVQRLALGSAGTVFNESGEDVDFRIEGDTDANLFTLDAGNNRIAVGGVTGSSFAKFKVISNVSATASLAESNSHISIGGTNDSTNQSATIQFTPFNSSGNYSPAAIRCISSGNTDSTLAFYTNPSSSFTSSPTKRAEISPNGFLGINNGATTPTNFLHIVDGLENNRAAILLDVNGDSSSNIGRRGIQINCTYAGSGTSVPNGLINVVSEGKFGLETIGIAQTWTVTSIGNTSSSSTGIFNKIQFNPGLTSASYNQNQIGFLNVIDLNNSAPNSAGNAFKAKTYGIYNDVTAPNDTNQEVFNLYLVNSGTPSATTNWAIYQASSVPSYFAGNVGFGTAAPAYRIQLSSDSAAKPSTNTWTISSDERIKENIELADLDICYDAVKSIPLKRYRWRDEIYSSDDVPDRTKLGWIAQDVEAVFPKAVGTHELRYNQVYEELIVPATEDVYDEDGNLIEKGQPERVEKVLVSEDKIEDCKSLNADQIYATMYGAIQKLIQKVETLEAELAALKG
jgi:hypothetical protein